VDIRKLVLGAALAVAMAVPAGAEPVSATPNAKGRVLILVPLELTKIDDLAFGTIIPSTGVSGTVTINPKTGARTVSGGVTGDPGDVGHRALFGGAGSPGRQVFVEVAQPASLTSTTSTADKITVLALTLDGSAMRTIDPDTRTFFFGIGGIIEIAADQPEGVYETTFDVTATYL
jgi:hypothetical protein